MLSCSTKDYCSLCDVASLTVLSTLVLAVLRSYMPEYALLTGMMSEMPVGMPAHHFVMPSRAPARVREMDHIGEVAKAREIAQYKPDIAPARDYTRQRLRKPE